MEYTGPVTFGINKHIGTTVSETSAAFEGMWYGFLEHYHNCNTCEDEEAGMPHSIVLALSFTHESLSAIYIYMQSAFKSVTQTDETHFDLGFKHISESRNSHRIYRTKIRNTIIRVGQTAPGQITELLLLGEDTDNHKFLETIQDELQDLIPENSTNIKALSLESLQVIFDPLFIAARGAADFAKRSLEAPPNCREPPRRAKDRLLSPIYSED